MSVLAVQMIEQPDRQRSADARVPPPSSCRPCHTRPPAGTTDPRSSRPYSAGAPDRSRPGRRPVARRSGNSRSDSTRKRIQPPPKVGQSCGGHSAEQHLDPGAAANHVPTAGRALACPGLVDLRLFPRASVEQCSWFSSLALVFNDSLVKTSEAHAKQSAPPRAAIASSSNF